MQNVCAITIVRTVLKTLRKLLFVSFEFSKFKKYLLFLSPISYQVALFIIALETLAIKIREDDGINGITIRDESVKLSLFADDMTCFLKDSSSYTNLFVTLKTFGESSGSKIIMNKPKP